MICTLPSFPRSRGGSHSESSCTTVETFERPAQLDAASSVGADVECVSQAVAEQVEGERRHDEEHAGEHHQPPCYVVETRGISEDLPPRRLVGRDAEAQVRERGLEEDALRDQQRRVAR